jgi:magnesium chelatase subunit I
LIATSPCGKERKKLSPGKRLMSPTKKRNIENPIAGETHIYPFAAVVGQDEMKLSLILNAVDPAIGGVMIMGHRGTAKSTAVRGLADLLPIIKKVKDCFYGCDPNDPNRLCPNCMDRLKREGSLPYATGHVPVVTLPLGATEDRVCGTLDIERALVSGVKAFEPGLLARANRGFLYIDEVNLLEDHLVDLLLDTAASGRNIVEREGISVSHPARFVLVGSGNPEEGDLRPQLLDRFGFHAQIVTVADLDMRVAIVELRERFERDPAAFCKEWAPEQEKLRKRIVKARALVDKAEIPRELLRRIAALCLSLKIEGHRGELTIARAARALAVFEGRTKVEESDVRRVALISLRHRLRRDPLESIDSGLKIEQALEKIFPI